MSEKTPDQIVSEYWGHFHGGTMSFETVVKEIVRAEREASERKVEMLKKALEPFARHAARNHAEVLKDDYVITGGYSDKFGNVHITMGDVRLAASTLEEVGK